MNKEKRKANKPYKYFYIIYVDIKLDQNSDEYITCIKFGISSNVTKRFKNYSNDISGKLRKIIKVYRTNGNSSFLEYNVKGYLKRFNIKRLYKYEYIDISLEKELINIIKKIARFYNDFPILDITDSFI